MPTFHRGRAVGKPFRRPVAAAPVRVRKLEQRVQKVRPLGRPGHLATVASALGGEPDLEYLIIDSTVVRAHPSAAGAPPKRAAKPVSPWGGAAAGSAPRST